MVVYSLQGIAIGADIANLQGYGAAIHIQEKRNRPHVRERFDRILFPLASVGSVIVVRARRRLYALYIPLAEKLVDLCRRGPICDRLVCLDLVRIHHPSLSLPLSIARPLGPTS